MYQPREEIFAVFIHPTENWRALAWQLRDESERNGPMWCVPDVQHAPWTWPQLETFCALAYPAQPLVRVPEITPNAIVQALQCGARGLMLPQVTTLEQAQSAVEYSYFPPLGRRSKGGNRFDNRYQSLPDSQYFQEASSIFIPAQIEDAKMLSKIDDVMAIKGIDGLFIGVEDLTLSHGTYGTANESGIPWDQPVIWEAAQLMELAAATHNKVWGMPITKHLHDREIMSKMPRACFFTVGANRSGLATALGMNQEIETKSPPAL